MAQTDYTARRSTGGKAPRKQLECVSKDWVQRTTIKDHETNDVELAWYVHEYEEEHPPEKPYPFPYQVYIAQSAAHVATDPHFPTAFATYIQEIGGVSDGDCVYRFEVYTKPLPNILACVAHQRKEVRHRNRNGIVPHLVSKWTREQGDDYAGKIIVIDRGDWDSTGVVLVTFDPLKYDKTPRDYTWNIAGEGDTDTVRAYRCTSKKLLSSRLTEWWMEAGFSWTQEDLVRRNEGGYSPVLYPALDPTAHQDAEDESIHELGGTALPAPAVQADPDAVDDDEDDTAIIIDSFDKNELFRSCEELVGLQSETYSDSFGFPVTSVWDSRLSKLRPPFSSTLYLGFDMLPLQPKALFACLNKGLIAREAWTLDVVHNMPSLDTTFDYHSRSSARRTSSRISQTKQCMQKVLQKVAESKLPTELLEHIEDILVPPEIPVYSGRPCRPFKDVFMYLDATLMSTGPLLVYANPAAFSDNAEAKRFGFTEPDMQSWSPWREAAFEDDLLRVTFLRYWHRVADELHVLWSLCGPRATGPDDSQLPSISLKLSLPTICVWRPPGECNAIDKADVQIVLQSYRPITVQSNSLFSHDLWAEAVEVVNLKTGSVLPPLLFKGQSGYSCYDTWARTRKLGFRDPHIGIGYNGRIKTFHPGTSPNISCRHGHEWWGDRVKKGMFVNGQKYAVRLKPGTTVPRWTWGVEGDLQGHYNLPPIPVSAEEVRFTFRIEEGRTIGHFGS